MAIVLVAFAGLAGYCDRSPLASLPGDSLAQFESACASPINECIKGTVDFNPIEGGCWLIKGDNGKSYQPVGGLEDRYKTDGLRVFAVFRPNNEVAGFCPGQFVNLVSITALPGPTTPGDRITPIPPVTP